MVVEIRKITSGENVLEITEQDATNRVIIDQDFGITTIGRIEEINTTAKTANYTVTTSDDIVLCDSSGGAFTVTLPASPENGRTYTIVLETGGFTLTVDGNGKNINGTSTKLMASTGSAMQIIYNGTQWSIK